MPGTFDMSAEGILNASAVIRQYIRDQNLADDELVPGGRLIQVCFEEFYNDVERGTEAWLNNKRIIVRTIRRMVSDGMLCLLKKDKKPFFKLPSEQSDDHDASTIEVEQREKDAEEAETSLLEDGPEVEDTEADRHAAGCAEMIRGARPILEPPAEEDMSTPSRKRRRIEIATSDSSSWNSISPIRHPNSTPRRRPQPPMSPLSGSRRRSAPMQYSSPEKVRDTRQIRPEEQPRFIFKDEKKDTSPRWLLQAVARLRLKYPDDLFEARNGIILCIDCDRTVKAGNNNVSAVEAHLKGQGHRALVEDRLQCGPIYQESKVMKKVGIDYKEQQSYVAIPQKSEQNWAELGQRFFGAMHNDSQNKSIRLSFVERKVQEAEKMIAKQREDVDKSLVTSEKSLQETKDNLSVLTDVLKSTETKLENKIGEVFARLHTSDSKNNGWGKEMKQQIIRFEDSCEEKLNETNDRVARNFQKTSDQYDKMKDHVTRTDFTTKSRLEQLAGQVKQLMEKSRIQDEEIEKLRSQAQEDQVKVQSLGTEVERLEEANKQQDEQIHDLLSQSQLQTEELQRQRESDQSFRKTITDQIEAHFQQTDRSIKKLTAKHQEQMKILQQQLSDQIQSKDEYCSKRIRSLEKKNADQGNRIKMLEKVIPAILEDAKEMRDYMTELGTSIAESEAPETSPE